MNEHGKSDSPIVPEKPANKVWLQKQPAAEPVEERGLAEGNPSEQPSRRTQCRERLQHELGRIRQAVRKDREQRMTSLWHHYVLDLWIDQWRRKQAKGDVIVVRYADDFVMGFQSESEARTCLQQLRERLAAFNLELHPEKTRLIEFGRYATANRKRGGKGKPETFNFLGFTHYCAKTRTRGRFIVGRKTESKRMQAKLRELKAELRRRMHAPVPETGRWLRSVVQGYYNYHAVPRNQAAMKRFTRALLRLWWKSLRRRSHKSNCDWQRFYRRLARRWMPVLRVMHPYPEHRLCVTT